MAMRELRLAPWVCTHLESFGTVSSCQHVHVRRCYVIKRGGESKGGLGDNLGRKCPEHRNFATGVDWECWPRLLGAKSSRCNLYTRCVNCIIWCARTLDTSARSYYSDPPSPSLLPFYYVGGRDYIATGIYDARTDQVHES